MGSFEDQLWTELARAHGDELAEATRPPARRGRGRPIALAGGAIGMAGAVTALSLTLTATTSTPAYAVTRNGDGTVTITLQDMLGVSGANAELAKLGVPVRVLPMVAGCHEKIDPAPGATPSMFLDVIVQPTAADDNNVTVRLARIPAGDTLLLNYQRFYQHGIADGVGGVMTFVRGPAPSCFDGPMEIIPLSPGRIQPPSGEVTPPPSR